MLKHSDLTRRRIGQFLKNELEPRIYRETAPLKIEINENPCATQNEAKKGPWRVVEPGFQYGPAYTTFWFRLSGEVPLDLQDKEIAVVAEVGGERTVWKDNSPWCGIDWAHTDMGWLDGSMFPSAKSGKDKKIEVYVQVYTSNPQVKVHGREPKREALVEKVQKAELVVIDREIKDLKYDVEFALDLVDSVD